MIQCAPARGGKVKVTFQVPDASELGDVSVVGDFNDWVPGATPLRRRNGQRSASVTVDPGRRYAFRYLAENGNWFDDAEAHAFEPNDCGGANGIVDLTGDGNGVGPPD